MPNPPKTYLKFIETFPTLGEAWQNLRNAEQEGPLEEKTIRLIKLGISAGAMREGAVHSAVRKARAAGATTEEIHQVIALAAGTLGLPSTVAVWSWVQDELDESEE